MEKYTISRKAFLTLIGTALFSLTGCHQHSKEEKYQEILENLWLAKFTYNDNFKEYRVVGVHQAKHAYGFTLKITPVAHTYEISENLIDTNIPYDDDYPNIICTHRNRIILNEPFVETDGIISDEPIKKIEYIVNLKDQIFYLDNHSHEDKMYSLSEIESFAQQYIENENLEKVPFYTKKSKAK